MKSCQNCAWFCHADGCCYGANASLSEGVRRDFPEVQCCTKYSFDGLEDWEREACKAENALVTMEPEPCSI
jgi:hypothetical protein